MKRSVLIGIVSLAVVLGGLACSSRPSGPAALVASLDVTGPHIGEGGVPQFRVDPTFPKLPANMRLGHASAVSVDSDGHIWILHRPRTIPEGLRANAAPPVLEFDYEGNYIKGWGGEGAGYEWPQNEHGIHVDYKGFVWVLGNSQPQDGQILKFTKDGQFVKQFGKSGQTGGNDTHFLKGATALRVHPKTNELFVSDGYGNNRVIVFDAETGAFKRMWGAYGRPPADPKPLAFVNPSGTSQVPGGFAEALQNMKTVHDIAISSDDFVYVSDRGNKRIQVFKLDGTYVGQQFVGLDNPEYLQARSADFSNDPEQKFLYVAGTPVIYILNRKTLEVLGQFDTGVAQTHPPGHQITTDQKGNIYALQAEQTGADGRSGGAGVQRFLFTGFSPSVSARTTN